MAPQPPHPTPSCLVSHAERGRHRQYQRGKLASLASVQFSREGKKVRSTNTRQLTSSLCAAVGPRSRCHRALRPGHGSVYFRPTSAHRKGTFGTSHVAPHVFQTHPPLIRGCARQEYRRIDNAVWRMFARLQRRKRRRAPQAVPSEPIEADPMASSSSLTDTHEPMDFVPTAVSDASPSHLLGLTSPGLIEASLSDALDPDTWEWLTSTWEPSGRMLIISWRRISYFLFPFRHDGYNQ